MQSGFGAGDAWERAIESFKGGWPSALDDLRLYLTHFAGEPVAGFATGRELAPDDAWDTVRAQLGLPGTLNPGDRIETRGTPPFAGTVARTADGQVSLLLEQPGRGLGYLGAGGPGRPGLLLRPRAPVRRRRARARRARGDRVGALAREGRRGGQLTSAGSSRPWSRSRPRCTAAMNFDRFTSSVLRISSA